MYFIILISIILIISLALLLRIVWRRLPELKVLDISAIPGEKRDKSKNAILEAKFLRQKKTADKKISQIMTPVKSYLSSMTAKLQDNIAVMEKKYKRQGEVEEVRTKSINELFAEAKANISSGEYSQAEKALIEVISRDKKDTAAYEMLFDIYRLTKSFSQAEEIIRYLIKLRSLKYRKNKGAEPLKREKMEDTEVEVLETLDVDDELARYYNDLAGIYELTDKKDKALDAYLKANAILPNNPKFLDKVIDLSIAVGDKGLAKKTYKRLKEINPENAKLEQFREALEKLQ